MMFNLEEVIISWTTAQDAAGESLPADAPFELESHLRDPIAEVRESSQLSARELSLLACRRLEEPASLNHEFAKDSGGILVGKRNFLDAGWLPGS